MSEGAIESEIQPPGADCRLLVAKPLTQQARAWDFQNIIVRTETSTELSIRPHDESTALVNELQDQGGAAEVVVLKRWLQFQVETPKEGQEPSATAMSAWLKFKNHHRISQGFKLVSLQNGNLWAKAIDQVVRVTRLPSRFPPELHASFEKLMAAKFEVVVGMNSQIPWYAIAHTLQGRTTESSESAGVIVVNPNYFTTATLAHELQFALGSVVEAEQFLGTLPMIPRRLKDSIDRVQNPLAGEEPSPRDRARHDAVYGMARSMLEIQGSERALGRVFDRSFWKNLFSREGMKEMVSVWHELGRFSVSHLKLLYHMGWVNPRDAGDVFYFARFAAKAYIAHSVVLVTNGYVYLMGSEN